MSGKGRERTWSKTGTKINKTRQPETQNTRVIFPWMQLEKTTTAPLTQKKHLPPRKLNHLPLPTQKQHSPPLGSHVPPAHPPARPLLRDLYGKEKPTARSSRRRPAKTRQTHTPIETKARKRGTATAVRAYLDKLGVPVLHDVGAVEDVEVVVELGRQHLPRKLLHRLARLALLLEPAVIPAGHRTISSSYNRLG